MESTNKKKEETKESKKTTSNEEEQTDGKFHLTDNQKKWIKRGAIAVGVTVAAIGAYELYKYHKIDASAAKAVNQKVIREINNKATDFMKTHDMMSKGINTEYTKYMIDVTKELKEAGKSEYKTLLKEAWKEETSRQISKITGGFNAYDRITKNVGGSVIQNYAAYNNIRPSDVEVNHLAEAIDLVEEVVDTIKKRKIA